MTTTFLDYLPIELHQEIIDNVLNPQDLISYISAIPELRDIFMKRYVRIIAFSEKRLPFSSKIPKECLITFRDLCVPQRLSEALDNFRGIVILDCETYLLPVLDTAQVFWRFQECIKKNPNSIKLKINIRTGNNGNVRYDSYNEPAKLLLVGVTRLPKGVVTYLRLPVNNYILLKETKVEPIILDLLKASSKDTESISIEESLSNNTLDISEYPCLKSLTLDAIRPRFNFDNSLVLPQAFNIKNSGLNIKLNSTMCSRLEYLEVTETDSQIGTPSNAICEHSLENFEAPRLKVINFDLNKRIISSIRNIKAPLLESITVKSNNNFHLGSIKAENLQNLHIKTKSFQCDGLKDFSSLRQFNISFSEDYDKDSIDDNISKKSDYSFLENAEFGEIENGHYILEGLHMKNLKSLRLKNNPISDKYPTNASFPNLKKLMLDKHTVPSYCSLDSPNLEVLCLQNCSYLTSMKSICEHFPNLTHISMDGLRSFEIGNWMLEKLEFLSVSVRSLRVSRCYFPKLRSLNLSVNDIFEEPFAFDFSDIVAPELKALAFTGKGFDTDSVLVTKRRFYRNLQSYFISSYSERIGIWPESINNDMRIFKDIGNGDME
ncbi:Internalin-I [Wickerhamomyces ciferrii]|uniref:Internalin-I n=1 Tax=Wickerhamomyces ciferrii (strain ATCC 14091 / BCRC 22168 / CBS 111 / JCM 3599 / NBRC 0793 / NRRL Y-1031 F-60-10) TaxID=1206466 RepID=K0KLX1_WICCF|nr:Internalin-I [Wickerhamomyces ciferrii]CCH43202.1 Internalin-I [Wickerhamomyces ciferrii]